jgi:EpsI family protein
VVGADGEVSAFYRNQSGPVSLYIAVYREQRQGAELISSTNVMVPTSHPIWRDSEIVPAEVQLESARFGVEQHLLSSRSGERLVVWTWYLVSGHHTANPYLAKLIEAGSRLLGQERPAALFAVAASYNDQPDEALDRLTAFLSSMLPAMESTVSRAVDM